MIDASLAQLVTDENEVFVREGDTTLLMLGSRVRAPEGVQSKRLIINDYRSFLRLYLSLPFGILRVEKGCFRGNVIHFVIHKIGWLNLFAQ